MVLRLAPLHKQLVEEFLGITNLTAGVALHRIWVLNHLYFLNYHRFANIGLSINSFVGMSDIHPQASADFFRNRLGLPCFRFVYG